MIQNNEILRKAINNFNSTYPKNKYVVYPASHGQGYDVFLFVRGNYEFIKSTSDQKLSEQLAQILNDILALDNPPQA